MVSRLAAEHAVEIVRAPLSIVNGESWQWRKPKLDFPFVPAVGSGLDHSRLAHVFMLQGRVGARTPRPWRTQETGCYRRLRQIATLQFARIFLRAGRGAGDRV